MVKSWKDLTAEQYLELMESPSKNDILKIIYGKDIQDVSVSEFNDNQLDFLKTDPQNTEIRFYTKGDKKYGMLKLDQASMGEYIDLTTLAENWKDNIWDIMAIMYRPIKSYGWLNGYKEFLAKVYAVAYNKTKSQRLADKLLKIYGSLGYTVEKYDPEVHSKNREDFKSMPADQFHSFILFFSLLLMKRMEGTLKSMVPNPPGKNPSPKKPKQNSVSKVGDGTTSSTS